MQIIQRARDATHCLLKVRRLVVGVVEAPHCPARRILIHDPADGDRRYFVRHDAIIRHAQRHSDTGVSRTTPSGEALAINVPSGELARFDTAPVWIVRRCVG